MPDTTAPLVCICIPTYNGEKTIAAALASVLSQTYRNLVIHVVDNHSTDDTVAVVENFSDERITLHRIGKVEEFVFVVGRRRGIYVCRIGSMVECHLLVILFM